MVSRQGRDLIATDDKERIVGDQKRFGSILCKNRKGPVDFGWRAGAQDMERPPDCVRRFLQFLPLELSLRIVGVHEGADCGGLRNEVVQELETLWH
jgi:hypothetical protein